jgi:hypothetical protein
MSVLQEPYALPEAFEWCTCNIEDPEELAEVGGALHRCVLVFEFG